MRFCILLTAICTIIPSAVFSQQMWERTYGGAGDDYGYSVQQTTDSGYVVAGYTNSFGDSNQAYLIKTNAAGDTLWTRTYGGSGNDRGYSVQQTTDGGYIIAGVTSSFGNGNQVYLIKTDAQGDALWTRVYGGMESDEGRCVQQTSDGGYIITGVTNSFGNNSQVYLVKVDTLGDTMWTKNYGGPDYNDGKSVRHTLDGGYIVAGAIEDGLWCVTYLVKTNAFGDTAWSSAYQSSIFTESHPGSSVRQTADTGYIVSSGRITGISSGLAVVLIKTNALGDTIWTNYSAGEGCGLSAQQTTDGGYIVAGFNTYLRRPPGANLTKTDAFGNPLWGRSWVSGWTAFYSAQQTADLGYVAVGHDSGPENHHQVFLVKTDSLGYSTDVEEENNTALKTGTGATIICGPLQFTPGKTCLVFDITGQKVMELHSGTNNIRHLAPGVYFIRSKNNNQVTKIVVTR